LELRNTFKGASCDTFSLTADGTPKSEVILVEKRSVTVILGVLAPLGIMLLADLAIGDTQLFLLINHDAADPVLDFACVYLSPVLFSVFYVTTLVALSLSVNGVSKATAVLSIANGALSYGLGTLAKQLIMKPRPEVGVAARTIGFWNASAFSLPSTLTMLAFGLALPILLEKHRAGIILVALSYFIGFSVIYTGFHFPIDVVAGVAFSAAVTLCTNLVKKPLSNYIQKRRPKTV
jgi:membrane-associated phospholipid phosphatase